MREFLINSNDAGQRLDKFVLKAVKGMPVSLMYKAIRLKKIKVNRKRAEQKQILQKGADGSFLRVLLPKRQRNPPIRQICLFFLEFVVQYRYANIGRSITCMR